MPTNTHTAKAATEHQLRFLDTLIRDRQTPTNDAALLIYIAQRREAGTFLATREVSRAIDALKAQPWKPRQAIKATDMPNPHRVIAEVDLSNVPEGCYAIPGDTTRLKVSIQKPTTGKWAGWVFVKDAAVYGYGKKYGAARPGYLYRGDITTELAIIASNPMAASAQYGRLTSRCGCCGRPLEQEDSVARGIGPVCAANNGWA